MEDSTVRDGAQLGPYSHLRPGSDIGEDAHVGNFVETKKTRLGKGSKANHLSYLGRCGDWRQGQYRRRHHHLQLRRREQAPDGDRRRCVRWQRFHTGRAGEDWARAPMSERGFCVTDEVPADALALGRRRQVNKRELGGGKTRTNKSREETLTKFPVCPAGQRNEGRPAPPLTLLEAIPLYETSPRLLGWLDCERSGGLEADRRLGRNRRALCCR